MANIPKLSSTRRRIRIQKLAPATNVCTSRIILWTTHLINLSRRTKAKHCDEFTVNTQLNQADISIYVHLQYNRQCWLVGRKGQGGGAAESDHHSVEGEVCLTLAQIFAAISFLYGVESHTKSF